MASRRKPEEPQAVEELTQEETGHPADTPPESAAHVTQEEHDRAIKFLQNEISDLKVRLDDIERIATQPVGSVNFLEINGQDPLPLEEKDQGDVPWYNPTR